MKFKQIILWFVGSLILVTSAWGADRYEIDPVHSEVGFSVKHLVINNVRGKFADFAGAILYDESDATKSSVNVTVKTASITTGNTLRDGDLKSANFFDVAKYPELTFQSKRVEKRGEGYVAVGTLNMHGTSKDISLPFAINGKIKDPWGNQRIGIEAGLTINRQDWGINYSKVTDSGGLVVGNDVKIELNVEAIKK